MTQRDAEALIGPLNDMKSRHYTMERRGIEPRFAECDQPSSR